MVNAKQPITFPSLPQAPEGSVLEKLGHRFGEVSGLDPVHAERILQMALEGKTRHTWIPRRS
jgi:hypothetical protein